MPKETIIKIIVYSAVFLLLVGGDILYISYLNDKSRDIQTLSEISQIQSGLELFLAKNNFYPAKDLPVSLNNQYVGTEKLCAAGFVRLSDPCAKTIMDFLPNLFLDKGNLYTYKSDPDGKNYQLEFSLISNFRQLGLRAGKNCATNAGIKSQPCF